MNELFLTGPVLLLFIALMIWSAVWKAIAMWKSARNKQLPWFVFFAIVNLVGIPEILYLRFWQKDMNAKGLAKPIVVAEKAKAKPTKKKK
jgi:hypothetical protein